MFAEFQTYPNLLNLRVSRISSHTYVYPEDGISP